MGVYSTTLANAYADKIKAVYEYLDEIRKVADRLTPVEDLTSFQAQIEELHAQLDLLVEASNLIVTTTPTGEAILTGSVASIQTLLGIGIYPTDWITQAELDAALAALEAGLGGDLSGIGGEIETINLTLTQLDQYRLIQLAQINGLQISYDNVAAGLETNQTNTELALSRLTVQEQFATLVDQRLDSIDQSLVSVVTGIAAANSVLSGHTAEIESAHNFISLHTASIDQLNSDLVDLDAGVAANASALSLMQTTITGIGEDIIAQSDQTTALRSVIGGSGNLLPNADFAAGANGWHIVVAEEDWAATVLTTDTFDMPVDVHCLEVLGAPTPLGQIVVESAPVLLEGGKHYGISGYPCVDNGIIALSYKTFDAAGDVLDQGTCPATFNVTTNPNFDQYTRTWAKFLASEDAVKLRLYLTVTGDGDWIVQGALFRPMVEQAWADQTGPSAWTPNMVGVAEVLAEAVQTLSTEVSDINGELTAQAGLITTLQAQVATLPTVYLQDNEPTGGSYNVGDIWFETDNDNKQYIWDGTIWGETATISGAVNYAQAAEPTGGSYNVGDQWIDTDDNNRLHRWNGTTWVDVSDPRITSTATALSALTIRVTDAEGINTSQASALTSLDSRLDTAEGDITSQASAISGLDTRVTDAEDVNTSQASSITSLTTRITDAEGVNTTQASALSTLTTRITDAENVNTSQASALTSLDTRLDTAEGDISGQATAISGLDTRLDSAEGLISSHASSITALNVSIDSLKFTAAVTWEFINEATPGGTSCMGFTAQQCTFASFGTGSNFGALATTATGADPAMISPVVSINGRDNQVVQALVRRRTAGTWQGNLYWANAGHGFSGTAGNFATATPVPAVDATGNGWTLLEWDLSANADWLANTQTQLRFDFAGASGPIVDVRWLGVGSKSGPAATGSAVSTLETRVSTQEGITTSQSSAITSLNSSMSAVVGGQANLISNPNGAIGTTGWSTPASLTVVPGVAGQPQYLSSAPATGVTRTHAFEVAVIAGRAYSAAADMYVTSGSTGSFYFDLIFQNSGGSTLLDTSNAAHSVNSTWERLRLENIVAPVGATKVLVRMVASSATWGSTWAFRRVKLELGSVCTPYSEEAAIQNTASATSVLQTTVSDLDGKVNASYTLTLDVNGYVSGYKVTNTGATSDFDIAADTFRIVKPGSGERLVYDNNNIRIYDAANVLRVRLGVW